MKNNKSPDKKLFKSTPPNSKIHFNLIFDQKRATVSQFNSTYSNEYGKLQLQVDSYTLTLTFDD